MGELVEGVEGIEMTASGIRAGVVASETESSRTASPLNNELLPPSVSIISCSSEDETPIHGDVENRASLSAAAAADLRVPSRQQSVTFSDGDINGTPLRHSYRQKYVSI